MSNLGQMFSPSTHRFGKKDIYEKTLPLKFVLTENEKYARDKEAVKTVFRFYETAGHSICRQKSEEVRKLYNLAFGRINVSDYVELDEEMGQEFEDADYKLEFFPIIPTIVRGILGSYDKMYSEYHAHAVNPDATNDLLKKLDDALRATLLENVEQVFLSSTQGEDAETVDQKRQLIMQSEEVRGYYKKTYRSTIEDWSIHRMRVEDDMFQTKSLERRLLEQEVVTEDPTIHVDFSGDRYRPEILSEKDTFAMRSPRSRDYSDSLMFGWFEYCTFSDILNQYGTKLTPKQVEQISSWSQTWLGETFVVNDISQPFTEGQRYQESRHNVKTVESVLRNHNSANMLTETGMAGDFVKLTTIYFYLPRKYGVLTVRQNGETITQVVDESFKTTIKPVYEAGMKKIPENLISGEHLEWFYKPELWRGKKITSWGFAPEGLVNFEDSEVWVELDRFEIQYSDPFEVNGLYIPVHGGPVTNQFNDSASLVKIAAPWQVMFNYLQNRNKQLMATEIGKYFAMNESSVPNDSLEGDWGRYSLERFASVARDTHLAPMANPLTQGGASMLGQQGGLGQVVDLTNTQDILGKFNLASLIESQCYRSVGLTPEFLLGDYSAQQTAKTAAMGQQRTATQLQNLLTRVSEIMVKARTTMLEAARYLAMNKPTVEMAYTTTQEGRILFRASTEDFPLSRLGVFVKSNGGDLAVMESIKSYVANNNTMGADSYEMATLMSFKSLPELFKSLKAIQDKKEEQRQQDMQHQQQMQEREIEAMRERYEVELQQKAQENALDRDKDVMVAQIRTLGYAEGTVQDVREEIMALQDANAQQEELYRRAEVEATNLAMKERSLDDSFNSKQQDRAMRERLTLKQLAQRDRELNIREKEIAARNKRTSKLD